jgi:histidyl-tRNA synthetase
VGISQDMNWFTSTLDKLDKIGNKGIKQEFEKAGLNEMQTADILNLVETNPLNSASLHHIRKQFGASSLVESALSDLNEIRTFIADRKLSISVEIDLSLARGLDYYTGCIFEVVVPESGIGSISGGGRYDDLTGVFGLKNVSGVGISFGIDRIYEILSNSDSPLFTEDHSDMILLCHFDEPSRQYVFNIAADLRDKGFNAFVYPDLKKLQKQLDYANKKRVKWVLIAGE